MKVRTIITTIFLTMFFVANGYCSGVSGYLVTNDGKTISVMDFPKINPSTVFNYKDGSEYIKLPCSSVKRAMQVDGNKVLVELKNGNQIPGRVGS